MPRPPEALEVGDVRLLIDPDHGARAIEWTVGDLSLLAHHGDDPVEHGMYPMAPWAGRLRDNSAVIDGERVQFPVTYGTWALHGTVLDQVAADVTVDRHVDRALLAARFDTHAGWPWPTVVDVVWDLRPRELVTQIVVTPQEHRLPAVLGWHPWFRRELGRGGPLAWSLDATAQVERGEDHLPTGRLVEVGPGPFDDAFVVPDGRAHVEWPGALRLEVVNDAGWYVIFDELRASVCVEPQSGPPNAFNDALGQAVPFATTDAPHRMVTRWVISDDPRADPA